MPNFKPVPRLENLTRAGLGRSVTKPDKVSKHYRVTQKTAEIIENEAERRRKKAKGRRKKAKGRKIMIGDTLDAIIAEWLELKK